MQRKIIFGLIVSMLFSFTTSVQAIETRNNTSENINVIESENNLDYSELSKSINDTANLLTNVYGETSVQYAISEGDRILVSGNSGKYSKSENKALTKDTMYGIGSVSKMFTTASVMKLVDEGKVDLDLPVINYIKDFKMADSEYTKITPRMLLNHSSGLMGTNYSNMILFNDNDTREHDNLLSELATERLKAHPGEFSVYCNDGFSLAEILVERVSGMKFSEYIEENFTKVLNMNKTKTPLDNFDRSNLAKTYDVGESIENPVENVMCIGAGGIYSTAEDLCKFINSITDKNDKGILSSKSIDDMTEKEYLKGVWNNDASSNLFQYGLGWDCVNLYPFNRYGIKALSKGGDTLEYHSVVITIPEYNLTIAVNSSGGSSVYNEAFAINSLLKVLKTKGYIKDILPDEKVKVEKSQVMPSELVNYSGTYCAMGKVYDVKISLDGRLILNSIMDGKVQDTSVFYHNYSGYFTSEDGSISYKFVKEKNGEIYLEAREYISLYQLSQLLSWEYVAQKVENKELTDEEKNIWEKRGSKTYFLVNEKYTSSLYKKSACYLFLGKPYNGYVLGNKIDGINKLSAVNKIPSMYGRDLNDYYFYNRNGVEYLKAGSKVYVGGESIAEFNKDINKVTIDEDGYAKWYIVSKDMEGKTITIDTSDKGAITLYSENGICLNDSYVTKNNTVTLKGNELLVFAGENKAEFNIKK